MPNTEAIADYINKQGWSQSAGSQTGYKVDYDQHEFHPGTVDESLESHKKVKAFLSDIFKPILADDMIDKCPLLNNPQHYVGGKKKGHFGGPMKESYAQDDVYTKEHLLSFLTLTDAEKQHIKDSHDYILKNLPGSVPDELLKTMETKGNKNGYVYVGGGKFNYLVLMSLKSLRESGSVFPVEVLIPTTAEFDIQLCNYIFPMFNARCLVIEDFLPKETKGRVSKYQLKSVALLLNSFQNVLLLDVDNMILKNPDYLFESEPFTSKGLITWPDMWRRSTSPIFYEIAGVDVKDDVKPRNSYWHVLMDGQDHGYSDAVQKSFHDYEGAVPESSTESGQLLVNKKTHLNTIFLSLYYNFHGPSYYYPLLTQNSHGEGDKETYLTAAHVLGQPYYQVEEFPRDFHRDHMKLKRGKQREILAIGQYDPVVEYKLVKSNKPKQDVWNDVEYSNPKTHWEYKIWKDSQLLFLHCNQPKLNAWDLILKKGIRGFQDAKGNRRRLYDGLYGQLGFDYELQLVQIQEWFWCGNSMKINGIPDYDEEQMCNELKEQEKYLKEHVY